MLSALGMARKSIMKVIALLPLIAAAQFCLGASDAAELLRGPWSEPIRGLRARLAVAPGEVRPDGRRWTPVFLEFENAAYGIKEIFYQTQNLRPQLLDGSGQPPPPITFGGSRPSLRDVWLVLPGHEATLKFRISIGGAALGTRDAGTAIGLDAGSADIWFVPDASDKEYWLSATFTAKPPRKHPDFWEGTLTLPAVRVPTKTKQ